MYCCHNCFNDTFLVGVINRKSTIKGRCDFCKTQDINIINPIELGDYFQPLFDLYDIAECDGKSISHLFKEDWVLFKLLSDKETIKLLELIYDMKLDSLFIAKENGQMQNILNWQEFKMELKHNNRYFPKKAPSYEHINGLLQYIILPNVDIPNYLYRARVNIDTQMINIEEMGKPPEKISSAGRANPIGIPYLYTASNTQTAISEIRPHKWDSITVATFEVKENLVLADLRNPRQSISPFELNENGLNQIFMDLEYLCHLGEELSKPILPREAHLEYLSSQYLCELIKHCGFDGVVYKSSVGDGDNYAIFSDFKLKPIEVKVYIVDNIEITSTEI